MTPTDLSLVDSDNYSVRYEIWQPKYDYDLCIGTGFVIPVLQGHEPNWFHRKMQTLVLGIKWRKRAIP